jgi:hypothetical protein
MQTVHAFARTSFKYVDGWSHLDSDEFVATVRLTAPKVVEQGEGYDEGDTYVQYTRVPRNISAKDLAQALRDTMGGSNCRHEYDCCGCATRYVRTKLIAPRKLQIRTQISYNY